MTFASMGEQTSLLDPDTWSGRTYPEHSHRQKAKTSEPLLRKPRGSSTPKFLFLDLRKGNGLLPDASWETDIASLGGYSTRSFGESPSVAVESHLSQILEADPHPKYYLSATACRGILRRSERRGKKIPEMLKEALEQTIAMEEHIRCSSDKDARGGAKER